MGNIVMRVAVVGAVCLTIALLLAGGTVFAEEPLPGVVADAMYRAEATLREGGEDLKAAGETALGMLDEHRGQASASLRFWLAYVSAWRAADRDEPTLWTTIIQPLQDAHPKSATFDLVRARLSDDPKERRTLIDAAIARDPNGLEARVMLARSYLDNDKLDEADALLDELREIAPDDRRILIAKGDIYVKDGMGKSAMKIADEGLQTFGEDAGFYALKARAALVRARRSYEQLAVARVAAQKAVDLDPNPAHIDVLIRSLKKLGEDEEASRVLDEQFRRTGSSGIGAILGRESFERGDYVTAIRTLAPGIKIKLAYAKAHAVSLARTGQTAAASAAVQSILVRDPSWKSKAAHVLHIAGDMDGAAQLLDTSNVEDRVLSARLAAWRGDSAGVLSSARDILLDGSLKSEEVFAYFLMARVLHAIGPEKADTLRAELIRLRGKINRRPRDAAEDPGQYQGGEAKTEGYAVRAVTYFLTPDGHRFQPEGGVKRGGSRWTSTNGGVMMFSGGGMWTVTGHSVADPEYKRQFSFSGESENSFSRIRIVAPTPPKKPKKEKAKEKDDEEKDKPDGDKEKDPADDKKDKPDEEKPDDEPKEEPAPEDDTPAPKPKKKGKAKEFADAVAKLNAAIKLTIAEQYDAAGKSLDEALEIEPNWARAKVLRAAVRALSGDVTQIAMAGRVARKVHEAFPSDLLARQLAVYLDLWAGVDVEEDIREFEKFRARHTVRAIEDL